ncbi:ATPases involved in chromosome partitioning [Gottschalkia purinilytica]|uniref:ATPases involved in chromosome partitioning n=1 Tax=Gottschalkia purinilytica TaxID=1503 RepID=A0A0L0WBD0_GOTPU|nr:AAA family ATPase [Gottschalkia purinilytica]KNF08834.1 ATPases involved in chromosome partitioning [Gottschalkia purinilytica]
MNHDQAKNLRELVQHKKNESNEKKCMNPKKIIFTGVSEGVGNTTAIVNISHILSNLGYKVIILDCNSGFITTDTLFKIRPNYDTSLLLTEDYELKDIVTNVNKNIDVIYISKIIRDVERYTNNHNILNSKINELLNYADFILIDIDYSLLNERSYLIDDKSNIVITCNPNNKNLKEAYCAIKYLFSINNYKTLRIMFNRVKDFSILTEIFNRLESATDQFLGKRIEKIGYMSSDLQILNHLKGQNLTTLNDISSKTIEEVRKIVDNIVKL